jgi:outer membrane protein assembly factor BamB
MIPFLSALPEIHASAAVRLTGKLLIIVCVLFQLAAMGSSSAVASDPEWRGFRGIEHHSISPNGAEILEWAPDQNVKWSVDVPGRGHSSPAITGDRVLLTSAYLTQRGALFNRVVSVAVISLSVFLITSAFVLFFREFSYYKKRNAFSIILQLAFIASCLLLLVLVLFGNNVINYEQNRDLSWFVTSAVLALALALAGLRLPSQSQLMTLFLFLLPLASFLIFFRIPEPATFFSKGFFSKSILTLVVLMAAPLLLAGALFFRRRFTAKNTAVQSPLILAFCTSAIVLGFLKFTTQNFIASSKVLTRAILCFDIDSGQLTWKAEGLTGEEGPLHIENTPASPSPVIDGDRVIGLFGNGDILCSNLNGRILWTNREIRFEGYHGSGASPVAASGKIVILNGSQNSPYLCALDSATGELVWNFKLEPTDTSGSNRTPILLETSNDRSVLVWHNQTLVAFDLVSGETLWTEEISTHPGEQVASIATDGERIYCSGPSDTLAFSIEDSPRKNAKLLWSKRVRGPDVPSPVAANDLLFILSDSGIATCLDSATGEIHWRERLSGEYFSSPVLVGDRVYFTNDEGLTTVIGANPEFKVLSKNDLKEPIYATIVPLADCFLIRTAQKLYCIAVSNHS